MNCTSKSVLNISNLPNISFQKILPQKNSPQTHKIKTKKCTDHFICTNTKTILLWEILVKPGGDNNGCNL
jgi:hypothetical protein